MKTLKPVAVHKAVLTNQVLEYLDPQPGKTYLDVTFGSGGHTRAILEKEPTCKVISMDWDTRAFELFAEPLVEEFGSRFTMLWGNFAHLYKSLKKAGIEKVDGVLADFGTSQVQISQRPGFSVYRDTPLDMRMSPAHQKLTAAEVLNKSSEEKLRELFFQLGEDRNSKLIARAIIAERQKAKFRTTGQLVDLIDRVVPAKGRKIHPATKVFQALRIYVNDELNNIQALLSTSLSILNPEGRLVCISFHSLEDRIVKQFIVQHKDQFENLTPRVVTAEPEELRANPSARSAKLRAARIIG
ncbi:ribosomal RNA small subunit methyltransferase H [Candidatus Dependentiae bacterium Noda2021]|nr:ribosomal RNA small subunit methyltransferase H [Candidatus Dependentiae bacterium Noda2021]